MRKILIVATVDRFILSFLMPVIYLFKEKGFEVHVASNGDIFIPKVHKKYNIKFERSPFNIKNIQAYKELQKIIRDNKYDLIHCHTPVGGVLTRFAARKARYDGTKVIYTAHGFHFFKGAPIQNWAIFYTLEKWLSKYTDYLITINKEDYELAQKHRFKANKIVKINGVGVDLHKFKPQTQEEKESLRGKYGFNNEDFILIYAAELNKNKNQSFLLDVVSNLKEKIPNIKLLLAGCGQMKEKYMKQAKRLDISKNIEFLGQRDDIPQLLLLSDIAVSSSRREGLPVNVMEAMAMGLPLVVTNVRGNRDLVLNKVNGYVIEVDDVNGFAESIDQLYRAEDLRQSFGKESIQLVQKYSKEHILKDMKVLYEEITKQYK